jgi:hypothetical protein
MRRPASVTWLAVGVLIVAGIYLLRAVLALRDWSFLASLPSVHPLYIFLTGLIWTLALLPALWGLWTGRAWAPRTIRAAVIVYLVYFWLDRLLLYLPFRPDGTDTALPFWVLASLLGLALVFWMTGNKKTKAFFGRRF